MVTESKCCTVLLSTYFGDIENIHIFILSFPHLVENNDAPKVQKRGCSCRNRYIAWIVTESEKENAAQCCFLIILVALEIFSFSIISLSHE